jgi:iron complex outermembrane receptor protein
MQGGIATATGGTLEHGSGMVGYGGSIRGRGAYRVFADGFEMGHFLTPDQQSGKDDWHRFHAGFRVDTKTSAKDSLTIEGEAVRGNAGEMITSLVSISPPVNATLDLRDDFSGWSALARWKRVMSPGSQSTLQVYFDRSNRGDGTFEIGLNTFDLDFQQQVNLGRRQDLVWGLGCRTSSDDTGTTLRVSFNPADLTTQTFSTFVQDEIAIRPNRLHASLGAKLEHEYYNGFHLQPTARITWTPHDGNMFWAAISGAQSTPSRAGTAIRFNYSAFPGPNNLPALIGLLGNPKAKNERLTATEAGFRKQFSTVLSFDLAAFFNRYRDLTSEEPGSPVLETNPAPLHLLIPIYLANLLHGETHGTEMFANFKLASRWTLSPGYTFLTMHLHPDATSLDMTTGPGIQGGNPNQQAQLRSMVNLPRHCQWTTSAYFVGRLVGPKIPSYTRLDMNLAWQPWEKVSLDLAGQNLLRNLHREYSGPDVSVLPSMVRRSAYARLTWRF